MAKSAQLEREAEQTRSQLAQTLDELRERITPGQLVDQAVDYAKDSGGGMFVRNLGRQTTANPLPVALIGAGVAWLMMANGRRPASAASIDRAAETAIERARRSMTETGAQIKESGRQAKAQAGQTWADASERVSDWTSDTGGMSGTERLREATDRTTAAAGQSVRDATARAREAAASLSDGASSAYETAKSRASDNYERVAGQAKEATATMVNAASGLGQRTAVAAGDLLQFCKTQPLVLAGLGMAIGAVIGALIPATETEDRLMGETSDQLKDQARDATQEQIQRAKSAAKSAATSAAKSAAPSGLNEAEAEFNFEHQEPQSGVPAQTSLVPEAEHGVEPGTANEAAERSR